MHRRSKELYHSFIMASYEEHPGVQFARASWPTTSSCHVALERVDEVAREGTEIRY